MNGTQRRTGRPVAGSTLPGLHELTSRQVRVGALLHGAAALQQPRKSMHARHAKPLVQRAYGVPGAVRPCVL